MRQAWVHGSFMRAIEPEVLTEALRVQEALLGPTSNCEYLRSVDDPATTSREQTASSLAIGPASFFHSPLFYWNCSVSAIEGDHDLLETINERSHRVSPANLTLRHSTVFAGKIFSKDRLIAVDALVITLFHRIDPRIEGLWNSRAEELAKDASGRLSVYPANGKVSRSHPYEFRFEPMSLQEDIVLGLAYALMALYVAINLRRLRAFKSRLGLVAMVIAQIGISIFSSFTICALFKIDLSQIPRELYPFVVLAFGVENMFQLINAVLVIPPEASTVSRISNALGNIGHLALARAAQNLLILWLLSRAVWVTAFCMFSSIALVLDFFFHLTFFLAVLSVDVQRLDLQDSLDRANLAKGGNKVAGAGKQRWRDALLHGKLPLSTRVAGTAVMVCFVTALNWHFFDNESPVQSLSRLVNTFRSNQSIRALEPLTTPTATVNQARSPTSWLRLQDHDTAKEVIRLVKPHAHSFVARVYDPLVFVTRGADRGKPENTKDSFPYTRLPTVPDAAGDHILPFALLIVLIVAVVTILMNYLLWSGVSDDITGVTDPTEPPLSIKTYSGGHALDVAILSASSSGTLASLGLDRRVIVRSLKMGWSRNVTVKFQPMEMERSFWPVVSLALDDCANWLAICSRSGLISLLDLHHEGVAQTINVDIDGQQPSAFFFTPEHYTPGARLILVKPDGWLIEIDPRTFRVFKQRCCYSKIVTATAVFIPKLPLKVFTATKCGYICSTVRSANGWVKEIFGIAEQSIGGDKSFLPISSIVALPALGLLLVAGHRQVKLVNPQSGVVIYQFQTSQIKSGSLRAIHSRRRQCPECITGSSVSSFSILYTESETHCFNMHTYTLNDNQKNVICLHATEDLTESGCQSFNSATMTSHQTQSAGIWEVTAANSAVGVRKSMRSRSRDYCALHTPRRRGARERDATERVDDDYEWEAWTMSAHGEVTISPISTKTADGELFVSKVGPICKVGMCSVAVGFGNSIKLLVAGSERFDNRESELEDLPFTALGYRRRLQARKSQ
ncbi:MAG: hypothetical protein M1840_006781 [Geoglossum simile]|nr:MAG: hypothetical protein M1840_006781 [Geoglossum simile]